MVNLASNPPGSGAPHPLLSQGIVTQSASAQFTVRLLTQMIAPDGYIYWVKSPDPLTEVTFTAVIHEDVEIDISTDRTYTRRLFTFDTTTKLDFFQTARQAYLLEYDNEYVMISRSSSFFKQASIYHYDGENIDPGLYRFIIEASDVGSIVFYASNSMPLLVALKSQLGYDVYASQASIPNTEDPYISAYIADTRAQSGGYRQSGLNFWYSKTDEVELHLINADTDQTASLLKKINDLDSNRMLDFGITSMLTAVDSPYLQSSFQLRNARNIIRFGLTYTSLAAAKTAQELITQATVQFNFQTP